MAQKLIVEGNDAFAIANLCKKYGLPAPVGYETREKFGDFVAVANGIDKVPSVLKLALSQSDLYNIGVIIDANQAGAQARWEMLRNILAGFYSSEVLDLVGAEPGPKILREDKRPILGIWVMPDNQNDGYLESFLSQLIPEAHQKLWEYASDQVSQLTAQSFNELAPVKLDKARLHTYLSWKREPGLPFGTAIEAGYFDVNSALATEFIKWFSETFELSVT